jgi:hypothetical protein
VTPNSAGAFLAPVAMNFTKKATGTGVVCAYVTQLFSDVARGYERFTLPATKATHKKNRKHKKKSKKHKKKPTKKKSK